jgi:hypothetical protein
MSTNRRPRNWPLKPQISPDVLARFFELEHMPRGHPKFKDKSHELRVCLISSPNGGPATTSMTAALSRAIPQDISRETIGFGVDVCVRRYWRQLH